MILKKYLTILIFIFAGVLSSCEKKLDIDLPDSAKHIVVNGIINPEELIEIRVSKSQNALDDGDITYLTDADAELYVDGQFVENLIHTGSGFYRSTILPEINKEYEVRVEYDKLNPVNANIELLPPVSINSIDTFTDIITYDYGDGEYYEEYELHLSISITDNENTSDYYFLALSTLQPRIDYDYLGNPVFMGYEEYYMYFDTNDLIFENNTEFSLSGIQGRVFTDEMFNGLTYTLDVSVYIYPYYDYEGNTNDEPIKMYLNLLKVNKDIYRYIISYNLNQQTEYDPFAQPVQIFSNVENGLGLFSGYTMYSDSLELNINFELEQD